MGYNIRLFEVWYQSPLYEDPCCEIVEAIDEQEAEDIFLSDHSEEDPEVIDVIDITGDEDEYYD